MMALAYSLRLELCANSEATTKVVLPKWPHNDLSDSSLDCGADLKKKKKSVDCMPVTETITIRARKGLKR